MVALPASWSRTSTYGRARSGSGSFESWITTSPVSGRPTAITCMGTHGANSGTGATELDARRGRRVNRRDSSGSQHRPRRAGVARSSARPARRHPPDCRGRVPGSTQLLDRLGARGRSPDAHGGKTAGWRSVAPPRRSAILGRRRLGDRSPDVHAPPSGGNGEPRALSAGLLVPHLGGHHLP